MKKAVLFIMILFSFSSFSAYAADTVGTKIETVLLKKGSIVIKDFYSIGEVQGSFGTSVTVEAVVLTEPGQDSQRLKGLKISIEESGNYAKSNSAFLDIDEIDSLSKAMQYMIDLSGKWKDQEREYSEVVFSTKGYYRIGFYQQKLKQVFFSSCGDVGKVTIYFSRDQEMNNFKAAIDKGSALLQTK